MQRLSVFQPDPAHEAAPRPDLGRGRCAPVFVAGTRIFTARGPVAVERLACGDLIETLDDGYQPLLGCAGRPLAASPGGRPVPAVVIPAGMFGDHAALRVAPHHRLHRAGWRSTLYDHSPQVLVEAAHLVAAGVLAADDSGTATRCFRLHFDLPQIICAEGLWSEA